MKDKPWKEDEDHIRHKITYSLSLLGLEELIKPNQLIENGICINTKKQVTVLLLGFSNTEQTPQIAWRETNACYLHITHKTALNFVLSRVRTNPGIEVKRRDISYHPSPLFITLILLAKLGILPQEDNTGTRTQENKAPKLPSISRED